MSITPETPLALGSSSPRRREILQSLGVPLRVVIAGAAEDRLDGELPKPYLERIAQAKLVAAAAALGSQPVAGLLVADTIVVLGSEILGKPSNMADAERMVRELSGRTHTVYTRYAIAAPEALEHAAAARTVETRVTMRAASSEEIARYAATGEGLDKAGAYAAQGIGTFLIERVDGSYTNVVGLPACEVISDLQRIGLLENFP
jgi:septum formation protein